MTTRTLIRAGEGVPLGRGERSASTINASAGPAPTERDTDDRLVGAPGFVPRALPCRVREPVHDPLPGRASPFVMISDPDEVKEIFTAPPDVLHPGEGARILEPMVGRTR